MAKLFYTLQEAAEKLRKSPDEVMAMARNGLLQDLQDRHHCSYHHWYLVVLRRVA